MIVTLFVVQDAPYPARSGSPLRAWQNINLLGSLGPVHVFSVGKREADASMPRAASWTHVDSNDFPVRAAGTVARLRRAVWQREFPIENDFVGGTVNRLLREALERIEPTIVVISHWHHALPRALRGRHPVIADTHNVESNVAAQDISARAGGSRLRGRYQIAQWQRRERSLLRSVDRIWATSDADARSFAALDPKLAASIDVVPNAVDVAAYASVARDVAASTFPTVGYFGFFGYEPNASAAAALIGTIMPAVWERHPGARLVLVGRAPTEAMRRAASEDERIVVTGAVDDVRAYLPMIDVLAVPLTSGSGTRLKILEAFASRIPVVSTAKGAEGLAVVAGLHLEIAAVPEMAERCIALLDDRDRARRLTEAGYALANERYSWAALALRMPALIESAIGAR